jgi:lipoprotein-anchoring transpeptidase ErfK/SrfK
LKPSALANVRLNVGDDRTYGVGMPIIVYFDKSVKNQDEAEKAMTVTTTPQIEGAWNWLRGGTEAWWRPKEFWPKGTKVELKAALGDVELSPGLWGRRTYTADFSIGSAVVSTVDVQKHTLTVTKDGQPVRTIKVTTGKENDPRFRTRGGTKVIIEKFESIRMDAATTGTDPKDPEFYNTVEHWALRLTWSGEFLHARPGSERYFGRANVSHGCTGMSDADAKWLFGFSQVGDVVKYQGSKRPLEVANGYTVWDVPYSQWSA